MTKDAHVEHCFVAIPSGQTSEEKMFFEGWTKEVIVPAIKDPFTVEIAASSQEPTAITIDIFEHLLFDPVAVFDLGGAGPDAPANPNVMYELGIRHAFRLPSVILAWEHQSLPFDIGNQRAVKVDRYAYHFEQARTKIREFVRNAIAGKFYDPLESLAHRAALDQAASGNDPLQLIAAELSTMNARIDAIQAERALSAPFVEKILRTVQEMYRATTHEEPPSLKALRNLTMRHRENPVVDPIRPSHVEPLIHGNLGSETEDRKK